MLNTLNASRMRLPSGKSHIWSSLSIFIREFFIYLSTLNMNITYYLSPSLSSASSSDEDDDILSLHYWTSTICWSSTIYWCKGRSLWDILVYYGHLNTSLDNNNKSTNNWHWSQLIKSRNILIKHLTNGHFPKRHHASRVKNRSKSDSIRPRDCRPR